MDNIPTVDTTDTLQAATASATLAPPTPRPKKRVLIPGKYRNAPVPGDMTLAEPLRLREKPSPDMIAPVSINRAAVYNALAHQAQQSFTSRTTVNRMIAEIVKAGMDALMDELEGKNQHGQ